MSTDWLPVSTWTEPFVNLLPVISVGTFKTTLVTYASYSFGGRQCYSSLNYRSITSVSDLSLATRQQLSFYAFSSKGLPSAYHLIT
jgi:hypothetical protein